MILPLIYFLMSSSLLPRQSTNDWNAHTIVSTACLISMWPILAVFTLPIRVLIVEGQIPFFFFFIWLTGFTKKPYFAFFACFFGHLLFDYLFFFNPLFFFVWIASGLAAATIAKLKNYKKTLFVIALFIMPLFYICAFSLIALIFGGGYQKFVYYFVAFPQITIFIVFVNPIFNVFLYLLFCKTVRLHKLVLLNNDVAPLWMKM